MIRRKKLLKMGRTKSVHKTAEQKAYEKLLETVKKNNAARKKDKAFQELKRLEEITRYNARFPNGITYEPTPGWLEGNTTKTSVFDPVRLDKIDTDEVNEKRKAANIDTPIEVAAQTAILDAKEKAKRVAVICHKSGYQYIGAAKDTKDYGKKTSQME